MTAVAEKPTVAAESPLVKTFKTARRVSTPLLAVETPDPAATLDVIKAAANGHTPVAAWDCVRGLRGLNDEAQAVLAALNASPEFTVNPVSALELLHRLPDESVVFLHNAHRFLADPAVMQAIWNLRDPFKTNRRTLVLLGPTFRLPPELSNDVLLLDEPLPRRAELGAIVDKQCENAKRDNPSFPMPSAAQRAQALDALVGLAEYPAESVLALSLTKKGIDHDRLWERKIQAIKQTPGLDVWRGGEAFADLRGIDNAQAFMERLIGADAFGVVVFIDEGDKVFAGGMSDYTGDSGVSKDQVGSLLTFMQEQESIGVLLAGVAGTGKSALAKAVAARAGKITIALDLGGMKQGVIGSSEQAIRNALKVISAVSEGRALFIMTANKTTQFTPELNRRFPDQFFYDLPDSAGRKAIWPVYVRKAGLSKEQCDLPAGMDEGWTGAEIKRVCERASLFQTSVADAARFLVPQAVSAAEQIAKLRREAAGRFLSASYPGLYTLPDDRQQAAVVGKSRKIELGD